MRRSAGTTVIELMVTCVLLAASFAAIGELMVTNTFANAKLTNKVSGLTAARWALERINSDVRCAQGLQVSPDGTTLTLLQPVVFQAPINDPGNPSYGGPSATFNQQNGWTYPAGDTVVFSLIPDVTSSGTYLLQEQRTLGLTTLPGSELRPQILPAQTIVNGIIGPVSQSTGQVIAFRPSLINTGGVGIDLEVRRPNPTGPNPVTYEIHSEVFMRVQESVQGPGF